MSEKMAMTDIIEAKLRASFAPTHLSIADESEAHRGHAGWRDGGETHFHVEITAAAFDGLSRIARQRTIHKALEKELEGAIHALSLKVKGVQE